MIYIYFLYSDTIQQFYCGQTDDVDYRLQQHNAGETVSNKHGIPWKLIGYVVRTTRSEAMILEKQIKKRGIGRWLEKNHHIIIKPIQPNNG